MPSFDIGFNLCSMTASSQLFRSEDLLHQHEHGVVELIGDTFFERDDRIVRDAYLLGADLSATLGDVAVAHAHLVLQRAQAVGAVEWMHLQSSHAHKESRPGEHWLAVMLTQHMAYVLAQETLDALAELLWAVDVMLLHPPLYTFLRRERCDALVHLIVPLHVRHQVFDDGETLHRPDGDGLIERQRVHACLAGQPRFSVHFTRA